MSTGVLYQTNKKQEQVKLTVTYDMGWQKTSSGMRYDYSGRDAFIIGGRRKIIIVMVLYFKAFRKCYATEKIGEEPEEREYPKNFEGSTKIMEGSVILNVAEDALYNQFFIIDVIVSNNDSTMRAVLKHLYKGAQGQVLKASKVNLYE